ncbi:hypothetical protein [Winogradskyella pulchriflava]|uniref:Uncharacterized protein n=1 Tax=Winogradskyella pulchriflava TaxID=1110688 RepID=A0ABV6Q3U7_9FLAO
MNYKSLYTIFICALMFVVTLVVHAHPTGNMITVGDNVLWSYINPIDDPNHKACVMLWKKGTNPKVFIQSDYAASDYILYSNKKEIYIIERRYIDERQEFKIRILKTTIDSTPTVIWDWFKDDWRIGEGGFFMLSDNHIVFGSYPLVYSLEKGKKPETYFEFDQNINRIRAVDNNLILLLNDNTCYLVEQNGKVLKSWHNLIDNTVDNAPLNRNQLFDADYRNGKLLIAYWGNRSFDSVDENGDHKTILQQTAPSVPHWVAFFKDELLLFSSFLIFDGSTPQPNLLMVNEENSINQIWSKP